MAISEHSQAVGNRLLASLPESERRRLLAGMEEVTLTLHRVLISPGEPVRDAYFPIDAMISLVSLMKEGKEVETGVVGREGVLGIPLILGSDSTPMRSVVQIAGKAMKMPAGVLQEEFNRSPHLRKVLLVYLHVQFIEVSQTAACNKLHPIPGRLARWLLMSSDCVASDELAITHEYLAIMLGVRRASVTEAAGRLKRQGLISYQRGRVRIVDRQGLEGAACECYEVVKREIERLYADYST